MTPAFYEGSDISTSWYDVSHTIRLRYGRETHALDFNLLDIENNTWASVDME